MYLPFFSILEMYLINNHKSEIMAWEAYNAFKTDWIPFTC